MKADTRLTLVFPAEGAAIPAYPADGVVSEAYRKEVAALLKKSDVKTAITGAAADVDGTVKVTTIIINSSAEQMYSSVLHVYPEDTEYNAAFDITGRIRLFEDKKTFPVKSLAAGMGKSYDNTPVTWEAVPECSSYGIFRAKTKDGAYHPAGISETPEFTDTGAEPGVGYFYAVAPYYNGIRTELCDPVTGYRKPHVPKDRDFKKLLESFNKPKPHLKGEAALKAQKHESMIKDIYFNSVKLKIVLYMSRSYIDKKELFVYNGFTDFLIDREKRRITMKHPGDDADFFFDNNTFFAKIVNLEDPDLTETLLKNSILFCVSNGEAEHRLENGEVRYVPSLEVFSLCTQYFNECREWPSSSLLFATKNKELRKRMDDAMKKYESQNQE
jgi:hypothetical protein